MTSELEWPTLEQVEAAELDQLLEWNAALPKPDEGSDNYTVLVLIVARLRATQAEYADSEEELPSDDHNGWPS